MAYGLVPYPGPIFLKSQPSLTPTGVSFRGCLFLHSCTAKNVPTPINTKMVKPRNMSQLAINSFLFFFAEWCYQPSQGCTEECFGMCSRENSVYSPCYKTYHCSWRRNETTTVSPSSTTTTTTTTKPPVVSNGTVVGYIFLAIALLVLVGIGTFFAVREWRKRHPRNETPVVYTSMINPHPLDRWRYSWPEPPVLPNFSEYCSLILKLNKLTFLAFWEFLVDALFLLFGVF